MSEISITLPLSLFEGRSVDDVIRDIKEFRDIKQAQAQAEQRANAMQQLVVAWSAQLQDLLDNSPDEFSKLRGLRDLANQTTIQAKGYTR